MSKKEEEEVNNQKKNEIFSALFKNKHKRRNSVFTREEISEDEPEKIISDLKQKISVLEKNNNELHSKNEDLTKKNIEQNYSMLKMSLVSLKRGFASKNSIKKIQNDSVKLAEIIKEKDELKEMNEKMLDLLTDKALENEGLLEKIEKNKLESKLINEKYLERIQSLEEKIESIENSKGITKKSYDIDDIISEYNNFKERLKKQIIEYSKNEEILKQQIDVKEKDIQKLKDEIQGLESQKLLLVNQSEKKDRLNEKDDIVLEQLRQENDEIKRKMTFLDEKIKLTEDNTQKTRKSHESKINDFQKQIENEQNYLKVFKESKSKEIDLLKSELTKNSREINLFNKKMELTEKILNDEKEKNVMIQNKLDKKSKELQDMNEYTKKLISNKDNLISQYEEKIEEITKDKNNLISQNKELIEKIRTKSEEISSTCLSDLIKEDEEEEDNKQDLEHYLKLNKSLGEEIKGLKEQLTTQAKDLVELNSLDKEVEKLKAQNDTLINDNKIIKKELEEHKKKEEQDETSKKKKEFAQAIFKLKKKPKKTIDDKMEKLIYEKQLNALKKLKDDEKKNYEDQIKKMKLELVMLRLKNSKQKNINNTLKSGYESIFKSLFENYIKKYPLYVIVLIIIIIFICTIKIL